VITVTSPTPAPLDGPTVYPEGLREALEAFDALATDYGHNGERMAGDWLTARNAIAALAAAAPAPLDVEGLREAAQAVVRWYDETKALGSTDAMAVARLRAALAASPAPTTLTDEEQRDLLGVERQRYTAYVDGRMCHNCGLEPYQHECPREYAGTQKETE
jgi:hypothetical protein